VLSEILSSGAVLEAIQNAGGEQVVQR